MFVLVAAVLIAISAAFTSGCASFDADRRNRHVIIAGRIRDAQGAGVANVPLAGNNGIRTTVTEQDGAYTIRVPADWSGTVTPDHHRYAFTPASRSYRRVGESIGGQDYVAASRPAVPLRTNAAAVPATRPSPTTARRDAPPIATSRSAPRAALKQELVTQLIRAAHAQWSQRVVIHHPRRRFYGYCGALSLAATPDAADRIYGSDWGLIPEPHIFQETEDSTGHSGVGYALLLAYRTTGDKFLLRAACELGDTLLSAQEDNASGGWFYDMGVIGFDRQDGSPTYRQTRDYQRWVNLFPWGGHGNVAEQWSGLTSFDGVSPLCGLYLLRLYETIPAGDARRDRYFLGAKRLADAIVDLKDVVDPDNGFRPYGRGGIPQMLPYGVMKRRKGIDAHASYPYPIPHNVMVTLNDGAMTDALRFLIAFEEVASRRPNFDASPYRDAIRLNVRYLIDVFRYNASPVTGRGGWASQYWIDDGSERARRPTWGRGMEPPGVGFYDGHADEVLLLWWERDSDPVLRREIEEVLTNFLMYFRHDAPPVNSRPEWAAALNLDFSKYNPNKPDTWLWWLWYNVDTTRAPLNAFVSASLEKPYTAFYGMEALQPDHYPRSGYPMIRNNGMSTKIALCLREPPKGAPYVELLRPVEDRRNAELRRHFRLDADGYFFRLLPSTGKQAVEKTLEALRANDGFFRKTPKSIGEKQYVLIGDMEFANGMATLVRALQKMPGAVEDADGDGSLDSSEMQAGTDPNDSESHP